jgi:hypothetical protein
MDRVCTPENSQPVIRQMKPPRSKLRGITRKGIVCETPRFLTLFPLQGNLGASSEESPDSNYIIKECYNEASLEAILFYKPPSTKSEEVHYLLNWYPLTKYTCCLFLLVSVLYAYRYKEG